MKNFKVALVGCGTISYNHLTALSSMPNVDVVALCDIRSESPEARKNEFNLESKIYTDYNEMLDCEELDAVHVATPHYLHAPMAIAALKKDIYVCLEKPMCIRTDDIEKIINTEKASTADIFKNEEINTITQINNQQQAQLNEHAHIIDQIKMLKHHAHISAGKIDIDAGILIDFRESLAVFAALKSLEKIFFFDFIYYLSIKLHVALTLRCCPGVLHHRSISLRFSDNIKMQIGIRRGKKIIFHPYLAVGGLFKKVHTAQKSALSASGGTYNNNALSAFDIAGYSVQNAKLAKILVNILNAYHLLSTSFQ